MSGCGWCEEPVLDGEGPAPDVLPYLTGWHRECVLRAVFGGANHLRGACTCCGGMLPPDPHGLSRREAARLAVATYRERGAR